ncbi:MAG: diguanylate cyclase, partial [Betaproteobacteria bacterium]|nr:diguanylate cyclase [Betaproteobacteria bacterium]
SGTFAIAIADIDRFKSVNDTYGHHVGDLALAHVAKTLSDNMRGGRLDRALGEARSS